MDNWQACGYANIALIKYMGKLPDTQLPCNPSLSYTLKNFISTVTLQVTQHSTHRFIKSTYLEQDLSLSAQEKQRFIQHLTFLAHTYGIKDHFDVSCHNNFPARCGIASSASSFSALTRCAVELFYRRYPGKFTPPIVPTTLSTLSRHGSGSACRSFFSPWAVWSGEHATPITLPYEDLLHCVIITHKASKHVSSSQAHQRVASSLLFAQRPERATVRYQTLISALQEENWAKAYEITWQEFWDMHALFETASPPFSYLVPQSLDVLRMLQTYWKNHTDGPLITLDAGPNIHLLFRKDQASCKQTLVQQLQHYEIIE